MQNKNTRLGFTQLNKSAVICPPCGESTLKEGKGVVNKATLLDNPPSALCATSPTLGGKSTTRGFTARSGFTLIELLVVVLIIGILAAVAVPQYQKAVEKSKATQVLSLLKTLYQAQHAYYLANGEFATNFSQLDVDFPYTGKQAWSSDSLNIDTRSNQDWSIQLYKNAGNGRAISAGRVSGPYKGAGFFIYTAGGGSLGEIICAERERGGINFTPPFGRYCATLWGGKLTRGGDLKEYKLP